jgi:PAS domain S-box-containing protein
VEDIIERKQVERALQESEARYRTLVETLPVIIYHVEADPPYSPIYVSANILSLGYSIDDWYGSPHLWVSLLHPDDRERVLHETEVAMAAGEETEYEYRVIAKDGSVVWLHDRGRFVVDANGKRVWQGVMLDITERKHAEEELRTSEESHRLLFESNPQPMWVFDRDTLKFLAVNDAALRHYGYSREEFLGMTIKDIRPVEEVAALLKNLSQTGADTDHAGVWKHRKRDGQIIDVEIVSHSMVFDGKDAELVLVNDLTERRQIDLKLRESEEKHRTILERIEDGYFEVDLEGNLTFFNDALCTIFGYSPKELMGMNYRQYTEPEAVPKVHKAFTDIYQTGESSRGYGYRVFQNDGTPRFVESSATLMRNASGRRVGFLGILRDITERKHAEEALRRSEERYRTIIEGMTDAYWEMDLAGNLTYFNDQLTQLHRRSAEELKGLSYKACMGEEAAERIFKLYNQLYLTGERYGRLPMSSIRATAR